jgi:transglutaminase-like putative cysteine protease
MVYRYSWLAGFASIAYAFYELSRVLRPTGTGPKWQLVVLAGLALGAVITWTAVTYRLAPVWIILLNAGAFVLAAGRFIAPDTTFLIFPSGETISILRSELGRAFDLIQNGVEPVIPIPGLLVILAALFWGLGSVLVWGLLRGHPFIGLIPPLVVGLQLATVDRNTTGFIAVAVFVGLVAASIMAVNADERDRGAGHMARPGHWPSGRNGAPSPTATVLLGVTIIGAVFAVGALSSAVPRDGVVDWRASTGLTGDYFGSVAYNPFVEIQKGLVAQTRTPVFMAEVEGDVPPEDIYFRLLTLETFGNGKWYADQPKLATLDRQPWEFEDQAFAGPTARVTTDVTILALTMDWLPAPYAPVSAGSPDRSVEGALRVRPADASLRYDGGRSYFDMRYSVTADIPQLDSRTLATATDGTLSPLFATAAEDEDVPDPVDVVEPRELENPELYLELPDDIDPRIGIQARELTARLGTAFEKGLALEFWFRDTGGFVYDTSVTAGHGTETLASWLFDDPEINPDRRRGYCEQFATSMAVMARSANVPSRVVLGFTPGEMVNGQLVVRDQNAHAWVELWIPSQGWVRFDPTPRSDEVNPRTYETLEEELGFPLTEYLDQIPEPPTPEVETGGGAPQIFLDEDLNRLFFPGGGDSDVIATGRPAWLTVLVSVLVVLVVAVGAIPAFKWWRHRRRMRRLESGDITAAWEEIVTRLTDLGEAPNPADTPVEVAASVDEAMGPLATVYTATVYGNGNGVPEEHLRSASQSLEITSARLNTRYPASRRFMAWYRLSTIAPWLPRIRRRRRPR